MSNNIKLGNIYLTKLLPLSRKQMRNQRSRTPHQHVSRAMNEYYEYDRETLTSDITISKSIHSQCRQRRYFLVGKNALKEVKGRLMERLYQSIPFMKTFVSPEDDKKNEDKKNDDKKKKTEQHHHHHHHPHHHKNVKHEKDEKKEQKTKRREKIVAGLIAGTVISVMMGIWNYFQDKVLTKKVISSAQIALTMRPHTYHAEKSDKPDCFMTQVMQSDIMNKVNDVLNYPLLGEKGTPHLVMVLGPSGSGKTTAIKQALNGHEAVIYVDMLTLDHPSKISNTLYKAIALVPGDDMSEDAFMAAVSKEIKNQYHRFRTSGGKQKPYKVVIDSCDSILQIEEIGNSIEAPAVMAWLVWLMELSSYANIVMICSDIHAPDNLNDLLPLRMRYDIMNIGLLADGSLMKEYLMKRLDDLHEFEIEMGDGFNVDEVIKAFGGLFSDYERLFNLCARNQTLTEKFNVIIEQTKEELVNIFTKQKPKDTTKIIQFLDYISKTGSMDYKEAALMLGINMDVLKRENVIFFINQNEITILPRIRYVFNQMKCELKHYFASQKQ